MVVIGLFRCCWDLRERKGHHTGDMGIGIAFSWRSKRVWEFGMDGSLMLGWVPYGFRIW